MTVYSHAKTELYNTLFFVMAFGRNRNVDNVAWFDTKHTLYGQNIRYDFAYKVSGDGEFKTVVDQRVRLEDLQPDEEAIFINSAFALTVAYRSRIDLVAYRKAIKFDLHYPSQTNLPLSCHLQLTLDFTKAAEKQLSIARVLFEVMKQRQTLSRSKLELELGNRVRESVRQTTQEVINKRRDVDTFADLARKELKDRLHSTIFNTKNPTLLYSCFELQEVTAAVNMKDAVDKRSILKKVFWADRKYD